MDSFWNMNFNQIVDFRETAPEVLKIVIFS